MDKQKNHLNRNSAPMESLIQYENNKKIPKVINSNLETMKLRHAIHTVCRRVGHVSDTNTRTKHYWHIFEVSNKKIKLNHNRHGYDTSFKMNDTTQLKISELKKKLNSNFQIFYKKKRFLSFIFHLPTIKTTQLGFLIFSHSTTFASVERN